MKRSLTSKDIKNLKRQCSMGYLISILLLLFGIFIGITIYESFFDSNPDSIDFQMAGTIAFAALLIALIVLFRINWKYYLDIRNNEKIQLKKTLQDKSKKNDYYRNTITVRYNFKVDNASLEVDNELFNDCNKGDELIFNYALKSNYLLSIEKIRKKQF